MSLVFLNIGLKFVPQVGFGGCFYVLVITIRLKLCLGGKRKTTEVNCCSHHNTAGHTQEMDVVFSLLHEVLSHESPPIFPQCVL